MRQVTVVKGSTQERRFVATYERAGRLVAVLGLDAPGQHAPSTRRVPAPTAPGGFRP